VAVLGPAELVLERPMPGNQRVRRAHGQLRHAHRERDVDEEEQTPAKECSDRRDREPDDSPRPDPRETDGDGIEEPDPMADDPVLELPIETNQTGTS
jgi:hypothetical protein